MRRGHMRASERAAVTAFALLTSLSSTWMISAWATRKMVTRSKWIRPLLAPSRAMGTRRYILERDRAAIATNLAKHITVQSDLPVKSPAWNGDAALIHRVFQDWCVIVARQRRHSGVDPLAASARASHQ